jgi:hypothetical protein
MKKIIGAFIALMSLSAFGQTMVPGTLVRSTQAVTGAVSRTLQSKLGEAVSAKDVGAVGDNTADDTAAFTAAKNAGSPYTVPTGTYKFASAFDSGDVPIIAYGATLNPLVPASTFFRSFIDLGQKSIVRTTSRGAAEFSGTPTTYTYLKSLSSFTITHNNAAGYQQNLTSDSGGRTSVPAFYMEGTHSGYGDMPGYSTHLSVTKHPGWASTTFWTGNNSIVVSDGDLGALSDNVNLYSQEYNLIDNGFSNVTAHGAVWNFWRTSASAPTKGNVWTGLRLQSLGTQAADNGLSINGAWKVGLDFSGATLSNSAAIALKSNDRIYYGVPANNLAGGGYASTLSTTYQTFDGTNLSSVVGGVAVLKGSSTLLEAPVPVLMDKSFSIPSSGNIQSTVGASGTAAAPPAQPFTYLKIQIDGVTYVIPAYKAN